VTTAIEKYFMKRAREAERRLRASGYFEYADAQRQIADEHASSGTHRSPNFQEMARLQSARMPGCAWAGEECCHESITSPSGDGAYCRHCGETLS